MEMSNEDICKALIYCRHSDGALCNMCPYSRFSSNCSKFLLSDAAERIRELSSKEE